MKTSTITQQLFFPFMEIEKEQKTKRASNPRKTKASNPCNKIMPKVYTKKLEKSFGNTSIKISVTKTGLTTITININRGIK